MPPAGEAMAVWRSAWWFSWCVSRWLKPVGREVRIPYCQIDVASLTGYSFQYLVELLLLLLLMLLSVPKWPGPAGCEAFCGVGFSNGGRAGLAPRQASDVAARPA